MMRPVRTEDEPFSRRMIYEGAFHEGAYPALHNRGCSRGLNPPVSSSDLAM